MPNQGLESFAHRYRRSLGIGGWIGGVLLTIVFYYYTLPKPARSAAVAGVANAPTLQVGALPVT